MRVDRKCVVKTNNTLSAERRGNRMAATLRFLAKRGREGKFKI